ncbi:MAG: L-fucose:H+ symporter permease [Mangrovibacterium sp.]
MEKQPIVPKGIVLPFVLLTSLFFAWAVPNNLTDTMLAAFKRIMSLTDSKTAWIQVACYLLGYGCFAIPAALFIKKFTYKSGVLLGLGMYATGTFLFYPAMLIAEWNAGIGFLMFLLAIIILFAGLSILETSTNSYVCAIGPEETATQRLNFAQSFNPFGAITGVVISQVFILSQLSTMSAAERASLPPTELTRIQGVELNAVTMTYMALGVIMVGLLVAIWSTRMPALKEDDKSLDLRGAFQRLVKNKNYVWGVVAQFFYVGAQIAVWSFIIRYILQQLQLDAVVESLGANASSDEVIAALREVEPLAAGFYDLCEGIGLDALLPRTAEQAGATYYIISLILFVIARFACTGLMKFIKPRKLLTALAVLAALCCIGTIYGHGFIGVYALVGITGCMSLMFPTIYGMGIRGLGEDTKIGGAGMVMAIAGAAVLTQIQGIVSDQVGSIKLAYWVPAVAFLIIAYYGAVICRKQHA